MPNSLWNKREIFHFFHIFLPFYHCCLKWIYYFYNVNKEGEAPKDPQAAHLTGEGGPTLKK
jgi:hypothetical protein